MFDRKRKPSIQVNTMDVVDHGKPRSSLEDNPVYNNPGKINCIWFTQDNGKLHSQIIPNLSLWVMDAESCNFSVILWTNKKQIQQSEIDALVAHGITVRDHSEYKQSLLYPSFLQFLEKGISGDKAAFALASDIFRMSILELTPDDEYFIYVDPNDITLSSLKEDLINIPRKMKNSMLGFSFYAERMYENVFHLRNDVLIAFKKQNPAFFPDYLKAYRQHIENTQHYYIRPINDEQAQDLARKITNQITFTFFKVMASGLVSATFGNYIEPCSFLHSGRFLHSMRRIDDGNTWLPTGECLHEKNMFSQPLKHERIGIQAAKAMDCLSFDDANRIIGTVSPKIVPNEKFFSNIHDVSMNLHIKKIRKNLLDSWLFEIYKIHTCINEVPTPDDKPGAAKSWFIQESIIQSYKLFVCLKTLQNSSEFRDFITRLDVRNLQLEMESAHTSNLTK